MVFYPQFKKIEENFALDAVVKRYFFVFLKIKKNANKEEKMDYKVRQIFEAVEKNDVQSVIALAEGFSNLNDVKLDEDFGSYCKGFNLLMAACQKNALYFNKENLEKRQKMVDFFIQKGIDLNYQVNGKTAPYLASFSGFTGITESLLKAKADFNVDTQILNLDALSAALITDARDRDYEAHSQIALSIMKAGAVKNINKLHGGRTYLYLALKRYDTAVIDYMTAHSKELDLDINQECSNGHTPVFFCVNEAKDYEKGSEEYDYFLHYFKTFLKLGADCLKLNRYGGCVADAIEEYRLTDFAKQLKRKVRRKAIHLAQNIKTRS